MDGLFGKLSFSPLVKEQLDKDELVKIINQNINPPDIVKSDDVFLGVLYAASNQVNLQGGCFAEEELHKLAELIVAAPVMIGHKKSELPIGRVFKAEIVSRAGVPWLKAYFYWHKDQPDSLSLKKGIETGVYKECSLGFLYGQPQCAICGTDMRKCHHRIHQTVEVGGKQHKAYFFYKELMKVLEVSLVYRGAVEGTSISTLANQEISKPAISEKSFHWRKFAKPIFNLTEIESALDQVIVEPLYNGLWLEIKITPDEISAMTLDGKPFRHSILRQLKKLSQLSDCRMLGQLIPIRGNSRLPLRKLLSSENSNLKCRLLLYDLITDDTKNLSISARRSQLTKHFQENHAIAVAPYHSGKFIDLASKLERLGSSEGFLIAEDQAEIATAYQFRRKKYLKGQVRISKTDKSKTPNAVRFNVDNCSEPLEHRLDCGNHQLADNELIWVEEIAGSNRAYRYLDHADPQSLLDLESSAEKIHTRINSNSFDLYLDRRGDSWLDLHLNDNNRLLRISRLALPLLEQGRKFWCSFLDLESSELMGIGHVTLLDHGQLIYSTSKADSVKSLQLDGRLLKGQFEIAAASFGSKEGMLFCKQKISGVKMRGERNGITRKAGEH